MYISGPYQEARLPLTSFEILLKKIKWMLGSQRANDCHNRQNNLTITNCPSVMEETKWGLR